jgi:GT2 family glycosyltransferase
MIIQILSKVLNEGYLNRSSYDITSPFFAGANVAFRRQALSEAGFYDNNCMSGEDQDICFRIAQKGYELFFEPKAVVLHKNEMSLRLFARRWYNYGLHHPYLFKKHSEKGLLIFVPKPGRKEQSLYHRLFSAKMPLTAIIFLTPFLIMHILAAMTIISFILGLTSLAIVSLSMFIVVAIYHFKADIKRKNIFKALVYVFLRYTANLALWAGGFLGGLKTGMIYSSGSLDCNK